MQGGTAGDLLLTVRVGQHPAICRVGLDLFMDVPVNIAEAGLGTRVRVTLLDGTIELKIPPGTDSGRKLRVPEQGITDAAGATGDFYAVVQIVAPEVSSDEVRSLLTDLAEQLPDPRADSPGGRERGADMNRQAVVLVSGGLDSATVLAIARAEGYACHAITFDYGQRHRVELEASRRVGEALGAVSHRTIVLDTAAFRGSALTDGGDVPKARAMDEIADGIPVTYVPARNLVFLSYAVGVAEGLGAEHLFIGVNAVDYPDTRIVARSSFVHSARRRTWPPRSGSKVAG